MKSRPTLADYVATAIAPVLIVVLVGSLVFFLIEVFYQGQYGARLCYIMGLFVVGAVGIARISIDEGREYSIMYAVPLGAATAVAAWRFVEFQGPLAAAGPMFSFVLIGVIWWSTDRLTWDCTVIDEREKGTGEGLLQTAGLDRDPAAEPNEQLEGVSQSSVAEAASRGLWQRFLDYRRRPHAPGVWVLYFSLAALPIFGVGQFFLTSNHLASRRFAFQLLVIYLAAGLGLLLATSFLALRRTLRHRLLEMPAEMVSAWLGFGTFMIAGVLIICMLLPRTNAEYSVAHWRALATSPGDLVPSRWGFGNDGPEEEEAQRIVSREDSQVTTSGPGEPAEDGGGGDSDSPEGGAPSDSGPDSTSSGSSGSQSDTRSQSDNDSSSSQQSESPESGEPQSSNTRPQRAQDNQGSASADEPSDGSEQSASSDSNGPSSGAEDQPDRGPAAEQSPPNAEEQQRSSSPSQNAPTRQSRRAESQTAKRESTGDEDRESTNNEDQPAQSPTPSRSTPPALQWLSNQLSSWGTLLRFLYWAIVLGIVAFFVIRYWSQVLRAFREFLAALRGWLTGRDRGPESTTDSAVDSRPSGPTFADFQNPFASGAADRTSVDDLIRYTFAALEAWARDRGCAREPEQTPREFTALISHRFKELSQDGVRLAELYNQSLYAENSVPRGRVEQLKTMWRLMTSA